MIDSFVVGTVFGVLGNFQIFILIILLTIYLF